MANANPVNTPIAPKVAPDVSPDVAPKVDVAELAPALVFPRVTELETHKAVRTDW